MTVEQPISQPLLYEKSLQGACMWSQVVGRGKVLRITDLAGGANVGMLLYNAEHLLERYNMPDTLKGQHIFYLREPYCLHSDMGRIMASIVGDTVGWHDTVCGHSTADVVREKYGCHDYQDARNDFHRHARECFLIEMGKWGLGKKDLVPNINWFSKVVADDTGDLRFLEGHSQKGDYIELRMEMNTLVVLNTCQHPLDPAKAYAPRPVKLSVYQSDTPGSEDPSRKIRPENDRALINTAHYYALRG